jgi:hypothetical protein
VPYGHPRGHIGSSEEFTKGFCIKTFRAYYTCAWYTEDRQTFGVRPVFQRASWKSDKRDNTQIDDNDSGRGDDGREEDGSDGSGKAGGQEKWKSEFRE